MKRFSWVLTRGLLGCLLGLRSCESNNDLTWNICCMLKTLAKKILCRGEMCNQVDGRRISVCSWVLVSNLLCVFVVFLLISFVVVIVFLSQVSMSLTAQMLCAGVNNTRLSGCHGDSGGPYVCLNSDKRTYTLHGAVSWGSASCQASHLYTVFARVTEFLPWIKNHTGLGPGGGLSTRFNCNASCLANG